MALTQISTAGVKTDAIAQAAIADEAVDEARLQISNAGSNGQYLQKQSGNTGGLTWASVTGTTINNNADNRLITGSGTANTLEGEANLTYDGTDLTCGGAIEDSKSNVRIAPLVTMSANYTITAADIGKQIHTQGAYSVTLANLGSSNIGAMITILNSHSADITINKGNLATGYLPGNTTGASSWTLVPFGLVTILWVGSDTVMLAGTGIS